jgi:hypothetical protein
LITGTLLLISGTHWRSDLRTATPRLIWTGEVAVVHWIRLLILLAWSDSSTLWWWGSCCWALCVPTLRLVFLGHEIVSLNEWASFINSLIAIFSTACVLGTTGGGYYVFSILLHILNNLKIPLLIYLVRYFLFVTGRITTSLTWDWLLLPLIMLLTGWSSRHARDYQLRRLLLSRCWAHFAALASRIRQDVFLLLDLSQVFLVLDNFWGASTLGPLLKNRYDIPLHLNGILLVDVVILLLQRRHFLQQILFFGIILCNRQVLICGTFCRLLGASRKHKW